MSMEHNSIIDDKTRAENDEFNANWVNAFGFVGADVVSESDLDVEEATKWDANSFMLVWLKNIERLCEMFRRSYDFSEFELLDVGCGSGISTMFFNHRFPFKRFQGFDFSPNLIKMAEENKSIASNYNFDISNVNFTIADAKRVRLSTKRRAIFMFNPFGWETMQRLITNNINTLKESKSVVLYSNDLCIEQILDYGELVERDYFYNLSLISFE